MNSDYSTLILAAATETFTTDDGSIQNKYSFMIEDKTLLDTIIENYHSTHTSVAVNQSESLELDGRSTISIKKVGLTQGALITALLALENDLMSKPLLLAPGDALVPRQIVMNFVKRAAHESADISLIVFRSNNPKYSYVRANNNKLVEISEKKVISSIATAGIYYFKSAKLFTECAEWSITINNRTNGSFYVAPSLNFAVLRNLSVALEEIDEKDFYRFSNLEEAVQSRERLINGKKQD